MIELTIWSLTVLPSSSMVRIFYRRVNIADAVEFYMSKLGHYGGMAMCPAVLKCEQAPIVFIPVHILVSVSLKAANVISPEM